MVGQEKGLSADDVYDRATWRRMSSDNYFCFRTNLTPVAISGSATTNRTSALEPRHVGSPANRRWGTDMSDLALGSRPVGYPVNCRWGADRSAISGVGEQTCRLPSISALGSRQVGSPENCRWGPDMSAP